MIGTMLFDVSPNDPVDRRRRGRRAARGRRVVELSAGLARVAGRSAHGTATGVSESLLPDRGRFIAISILSDDAAARRVAHDLGDAVHVELLQDAGAMRLDRGGADAKQHRDFLVALRLRDQLKHFPFPRRQRVIAIGEA